MRGLEIVLPFATQSHDLQFLIFRKNGVVSCPPCWVALAVKAMIERGVHRNAVVVALANKLARIAWAVLRKGEAFERGYPVAAKPDRPHAQQRVGQRSL